MATYTKSASFSYSNLNSGSNLNITDLTSNDVITNVKLTSSLKFHTNISNPVKFSFYDGTTKVNTLEFSVSYNNLNANVIANSIDGTYNAMDIAYGGGVYVIAIYNDKYYAHSTNGSSFTSDNLYKSWFAADTVYPVRVLYGNSKFVIHSGRYSYYSSNGTSWERVSMSGGSSSWRAGPTVYGNGTFVATLNGNAYHFYSMNGTSWTRVSANSRTYTDGAYGGGNFVFITSDGTVDYSANGRSWSSTSIGNGSGWNGLVYDGTKFVAINTSGGIATSTNGTSWSYFANKLSAQNWKSIAYGNNMYIAIVNNSNIIAVSFDASTWYEGTLGDISKPWNRITYCNNKFWALCSSSSTQITLDPSLIYALSPNIANNNITYRLNSTSLKLTTENLPNAFEGSMNVDLSIKHPENYTITQNYYIENTTTKLKTSDTSTEVEGNSWSYPTFESTLTYNGEIYDQTTTSGDPESGAINGNKTRNVYYKLRTYTLTQHYYEENTTTKVKPDDNIVVSAGKNWSFPKYSDLIKVNKVSYLYSHATGDPASGTNLDSNKERIIYYHRIESVESISLFAMPNSSFLSSLVNDKKFPYANDIEFECGALNSNSITLCDSLTDKIFKIHISISSSATASEVISLPLKIGNNVISTVYCDLMNGTAIENEDIELSASQSLVLDLSSAADRLKATNAIVKVKLFIEPIS